jgi:hypothetical protein
MKVFGNERLTRREFLCKIIKNLGLHNVKQGESNENFPN